ncbi:uncharacterized protein LOC123362109 isoform X4 [Mauremys mutica]|uniref:uncharacterized protein LOC123362109 isoform X4 n=1 Tax=Mauremys mutica TaxID=74926 RepID=UPI001D1336E0|nr:uncharacterized protein LOC123362109 isoform X4 [Mauremys mutica]
MLHTLSLLLILALKGLSTDEVPEVALEGVASQSSIYDKYGNPGNAIDGSPSSDYLQGKCSHTDLDINPWWTLDLRAKVQVFRVKITNRGDCCEERLNGAEIRIGSSPERGGRTNPRCAQIDSMGRGETRSFDCEGMQGQYVTVTIPGTEKYLTLCEVQVFGLPVNSSDLMLNETLGPRIPNGDHFETDIWIILNNSRAAPNVALGKTVSQSSAGEIEDNPRRAIDGSLLNHSPSHQCSQTRRDFQPWWTVDLNATFIVSSVVITNRGDCCKERISGAEIRIGNSPELGGTLNPRCATVESMELGQTLSFDCHGMQGRYVTVTIPRRAEYLTLCEVQVFGLPLIFPGETLRAPKTTTGGYLSIEADWLMPLPKTSPEQNPVKQKASTTDSLSPSKGRKGSRKSPWKSLYFPRRNRH